MADQKIAVRIVGDTADFEARMAGAQKTLERVGTRGVGSLGAQGKMTAYQLQQMSFQLQDLAVQIASGQNPFLALAQQGAQLHGVFGTVGGTLRAVAGFIGPVGFAIGSAAAAVGGLALAALRGHEESVKLNDALLLTNNFAGVTAGRVDQLAESIAQMDARPVADVREALQALVASGAVGPGAIEPMGRAVINLQRLTGQSAGEIAKSFAGIVRDIGRGAVELNRQYNFLSAEQYRSIVALQAQGRQGEAVALTFGALNDRLAAQTRNLGLLEKAWATMGTMASEAWDALKGFGRDQTPETRLQGLRDELERRLQRGPTNDIVRGAFDRGNERLRAQIALAESDVRQASGLAARQASAARQNQQRIEEQTRAHQDALLGVERAGIQRRLTLAENAAAQQLVQLDRQFDAQLISEQQYVDRRYDIERAAIQRRAAAIGEESALERQRLSEKPADEQQKSQRLIELDTRRLALQREFLQLDERRRQGELAPRERRRDELGEFIVDQLNAQGGRDQRRLDQAAHFGDQLRDQAAALSIDIIADERARGDALIELERGRLVRQLDELQVAGGARKALEDDVTSYIAARQLHLAEQLKPQYQLLLEGWSDVVNDMRRRFDDFMLSFVDRGRDAFAEFVTTGKLNVRSLVDFIQAEFARMVYERYLARSVASLGEVLFGAYFGSGASSGPSGTITGGSGLKLPGVGPSEFRQAAPGTTAGRGSTIINVAAGPTRNEVLTAIQQAMAVQRGETHQLLRTAGVL